MGKALSITAFVISLLIFVPFMPLAGLILGIIALVKAKDDPTAMKGLAIAAIVISSIFILIQIIFILVVFFTGRVSIYQANLA